MKVLLINGSPRLHGNTNLTNEYLIEEFKKHGIEAEQYHLANKDFRPCLACNTCYKTKDLRCVIDDDLNELISYVKDFDGVILSAPIHYADISGLAKAAFDRLFYVSGANGNIFKHKVGAGFVCVRRSGGIAGFHTLYNYLTYAEMFIASGNYWNIIHGNRAQEAEFDLEGRECLSTLSANMAFLLDSVNKNKANLPTTKKTQITNFIREDLK